MTAPGEISRRGLILKAAMAWNGLIAAALTIPIVRYLLSPITRGRHSGYQSWLSLGSIAQFPAGETRLATFRNPVSDPWDGKTANVACWVRHVDAGNFQVFAVNCAHLG